MAGESPCRDILDQALNNPRPTLVPVKESYWHHTPRFEKQAEGSETMRKSLLVFLTILFVAPMLAGCCPCWYGSGGRGYGYERGPNGQRDESRDYREHR